MQFVIETLNEDYSLLYDAITQHGGKYEIVKYLPFKKQQEINTPLNLEDTIFLGTINMGRYVRKNTNWIGTWCDFDKFKCTNYYNYVGQYLLNNDYIILSMNEFVRRSDEVFALLGDSVFVRPDIGTKPFTGNIVSKDTIQRDVISLCPTEVDGNQLIIISSKKEIRAEWRFFVCLGECVAWSQYHEHGELCTTGKTPQEVIDYATRISPIYQPELCYVLDIGVSCGRIGVVELNSFSCSGMYNCNKEDIVKGAIDALSKEINSYKEI